MPKVHGVRSLRAGTIGAELWASRAAPLEGIAARALCTALLAVRTDLPLPLILTLARTSGWSSLGQNLTAEQDADEYCDCDVFVI